MFSGSSDAGIEGGEQLFVTFLGDQRAALHEGRAGRSTCVFGNSGERWDGTSVTLLGWSSLDRVLQLEWYE